VPSGSTPRPYGSGPTMSVPSSMREAAGVRAASGKTGHGDGVRPGRSGVLPDAALPPSVRADRADPGTALGPRPPAWALVVSPCYTTARHPMAREGALQAVGGLSSAGPLERSEP
jgi:hypothetical protein